MLKFNNHISNGNPKMTKLPIRLFELVVIINIFCSNSVFASKSDSLSRYYPLIEFQGDIGLAWMVQGKIGINILDKYYVKLRGSESFAGLTGLSEYGFSTGMLLKKINLGIGYSKVYTFAGDPNGNSTDNHYNAFVIECGFYQLYKIYFSKIGFNVNLSFTLYNNVIFPSLNAGLILGLF